jgi:hypothetical protein
LIAALVSERGLDWRSVKRMRLPKLMRIADVFAELDEYRERNRKR